MMFQREYVIAVQWFLGCCTVRFYNIPKRWMVQALTPAEAHAIARADLHHAC